MPALLVSFEGIDGSGKTTTANLLARSLSGMGLDVVHFDKRSLPIPDGYTREQMETIGDRLWTTSRGAPIHELGDMHWVYLNASYFSALREAVIQPLVDAGQTVIVDNWIFKFAARASVTGSRPLEDILTTLDAIRPPDLVFFLDVAPEDAAVRRADFNALERGNYGEYRSDFVTHQTRVRDVLRTMAARGNWHTVTPGDRTAEELAEHLAEHVTGRLADRVPQPS